MRSGFARQVEADSRAVATYPSRVVPAGSLKRTISVTMVAFCIVDGVSLSKRL
jgi:hypothetical protein